MKKVNVNISLLRIIATIAVVFLHTCSTMLNPDVFTVSGIREIVFRIGNLWGLWAVPVFFMISGYLLLGSDKEITYKLVFQKYISRLVGALLVFGIPFAIIKIYLETHSISVFAVFKAFVGNGSFIHLWYLYALIGIYLVLPILKPAIKNVSEKTLLYFSSILFVCDFIFPIVSKNYFPISFTAPIAYPIFYFVLGYYFKKAPVTCKVLKLSQFVSALALITIALFVVCGNYEQFAGDYKSPVIALSALGIFLTFMSKNISLNSEKKIKFLWELDRLCFGVYLIHPVFIQFAYRHLKLTPCSFELYWFAAIVFFLAFLILSFAGSFFLSLIPPLKKHIL